MNTINYEKYVDPYFEKFQKITLDDSVISRVKEFVIKLIEVKKKESHHIVDSGMEIKRWTTGYLGECAIEKYIGKEFVDYTIGISKNYHVPDLSKLGIKCGVKTVERGKFPLIFKKSYKPEIIVIKESDQDFHICGIATKDILNKFQSDSLVLSPNLRRRGTKSGFYGFEYLLPPNSIMQWINKEIFID